MIGIIIAVFSIGAWIIWTYSYYQVEGDIALIRKGVGGEKVFFKGNFWAFPFLHQVELIDLSEHRVLVNCAGAYSLVCREQQRVDIALSFFVQVIPSQSDVLKILHTIGASKATDKEVLSNLFKPQFLEALKTIALSFNAEQILQEPEKFKKELLLLLDDKMQGYQINRINIASVKTN